MDWKPRVTELVNTFSVSSGFVVETGLLGARRTRRRLLSWTPSRRALRRARGEVALLREDDGLVVEMSGRHIAVHRDSGGTLSGVGGICTHDGVCQISFDKDLTLWRCPRHGARFGLDGSVLRGPAKEPLQKIDVTRLERRPRDGRRLS